MISEVICDIHAVLAASYTHQQALMVGMIAAKKVIPIASCFKK